MRTGDVLARLSHASLRLHPDDIHDVVRELGAAIGLDDLVLHLVDLEQRVLVPLPYGGATLAESIGVDSSTGGRAYRTQEPIVDGATLWLPLLDSAERFGVVRASLADAGSATPEQIDEWMAFASLVGEVVANKQDHGDVVATTRRTAPMSVAAELRWAMLPPLTFTGRNMTVSGIVLPTYSIAGDTFDYAVNGDVAHIVIIDAV